MDGGEYGLQAPEPLSDEVFIDMIWRSVWATGPGQGFRFGLWVPRGGQGALEDPQSCVCTKEVGQHRFQCWKRRRLARVQVFLKSLFLPAYFCLNKHTQAGAYRKLSSVSCCSFCSFLQIISSVKVRVLERWQKRESETLRLKGKTSNAVVSTLHQTPSLFSSIHISFSDLRV